MHEHHGRISRRRLLQLGAASAAVLSACTTPLPSIVATPTRRPSTAPATATAAPTSSASASPSPTPRPLAGRILYRNGALADGRSAALQRNISILINDGRIEWIRPAGGEEDPSGATIVDAGGAAFVPGMVDAHSHVTNQGGVNYIDRYSDPPHQLVANAEHNARIALRAGTRWMRDVGSPIAVDPVDGRERALALGIRDRWAGRPDTPYLRAAGSWLFKRGSSLVRGAVEVQTGDELLEAALGQLDAGADLVKLYMDGPDFNTSPWSVNEVAAVVEAVHARGARVTVHSGRISGARVAAAGGVDSMEHGFELDAGVAAEMAQRGIVLISTLSVLRSFITFSTTTTAARYGGEAARAQFSDVLAMNEASIRFARDAGVAIAAGTDFGGGSGRANHMAWEVTSLVAAGLQPVDALAAATWRGGELLGETEAGVIREGGPADFFLVHGDPLSEPEALWRVWRTAWEDSLAA